MTDTNVISVTLQSVQMLVADREINVEFWLKFVRSNYLLFTFCSIFVTFSFRRLTRGPTTQLQIVIFKILFLLLSNPFPKKPWFVRVCITSLTKTLWEKEKLLVTSNFSFSHSVFSYILRTFCHFH